MHNSCSQVTTDILEAASYTGDAVQLDLLLLPLKPDQQTMGGRTSIDRLPGGRRRYKFAQGLQEGLLVPHQHCHLVVANMAVFHRLMQGAVRELKGVHLVFEGLENLSHHPNQEKQPRGQRADLCRWEEHLCCLVPQGECDGGVDGKQFVDNSYQIQTGRCSTKASGQESLVEGLRHRR